MTQFEFDLGEVLKKYDLYISSINFEPSMSNCEEMIFVVKKFDKKEQPIKNDPLPELP